VGDLVWPFDKTKKDQPERKEPSLSAEDAAREKRREIMRMTIDRQKATDPLVGAKVTGKDIVTNLMAAMKDQSGRVHVETILTAVGALAGFACQASVFAKCINEKSDVPVMVVEAKDGRKLLYGDALNAPLASNKYSIWSLAAGAAQSLGAPLPDLHAMFADCSAAIGTEKFGVPTYQGAAPAADLPINFLKALWPTYFPMFQKYGIDPDDWPIAVGLAAQDIILQGKDVIDPTAAVRIVMESAIPMSKIRTDELTREA
jgi:hypothetical protein